MAYTPPFMLATGDYEGRICVWNIHTGERRCTLTHEASEHQRGVEQLLFLRASKPSAPPILLSCGGKLVHGSVLNLSCEASTKLVVMKNRVGKAEEEGREGDGGLVWQAATLHHCQLEL